MIRCANCSHDHAVVSGTCPHCGQAIRAEHEAPAFDTPTVHAKVEHESGTISFEHAYGAMNSESASSFMSIIPAEILAADSGIGYLLQKSSMLLQTNKIFVALLTICILGFVVDRLFRLCVDRLLSRFVSPASI